MSKRKSSAPEVAADAAAKRTGDTSEMSAPNAVASTEAAPPEDRVEKYTATLKCGLSPEEVAKRADRAANLVAQIGSKEEEAKAAQKQAKGEIERLESELRQLSGEVASRVTYRPVECERRFCFSEGVMRETRMDSFDLVNVRKLTEHERQMHLPLDDDDQSWRDVPLPISSLGEKVADALAEVGVTTLGSLSDFQAEHGDAWHQKVKGIGPETAMKIADAAADWWRARA